MQPAPPAPAARVCLPPCPVCEAAGTRAFAHVDSRDYLACDHCAALFLDPAQRPDRATEHAQYRLHRNEVDDPRYRAFLARLSGPLLQRLPPAQHGLDFGCGPGPALAAMLREAGHRVALYDPLFAPESPDAAVLAARYDFVTCTEVVEHLHRPAAELRRLDGLLRPGGWLAVMTSFAPADAAAFARWHYRRDPTHVVFYRPATFEAVARRHRWALQIPADGVVLLHKAATGAAR